MHKAKPCRPAGAGGRRFFKTLCRHPPLSPLRQSPLKREGGGPKRRMLLIPQLSAFAPLWPPHTLRRNECHAAAMGQRRSTPSVP